MFKFIILGVVVILCLLLLAEPIMQVGHRIANKFKGISDTLDEENDESSNL